jgi:hypothetical protein
MINKKICNSDKDCDNNYLCSFNDDDINNYCINNNIENLYKGCLKDNKYNYESIESKNYNNEQTYNDCIDFSRKQTNKDGFEYNYMIYHPKKKINVDKTTINIYLKCDEQILSVIPYNDYFDIACDNNQENCILTGKKILNNFIEKNTNNCNGKIYLEVIYECNNEGLKKILKIPYLNNSSNIKINLNCPINSNPEYKTKCEALYINNINDDLEYYFDDKINMNNCKNPVFTIPRIVTNIDKYKKMKKKISQSKIKNYDEKINEKISDLRKLEAEKYIILKKIQTGKDISLEEALEIISKKPLKDNTNNWKIYNNYDAAQKLFDYSENNVEILKYYGKVYTIQDAMDIANKNDEPFFVWYHNSFELDNFASKLYFIDIYSLNENILKK